MALRVLVYAYAMAGAAALSDAANESITSDSTDAVLAPLDVLWK